MKFNLIGFFMATILPTMAKSDRLDAHKNGMF